MANKNDQFDHSRRKFLKGVGSGIVGAYTLSPAVQAKAEILQEKIVQSFEGKEEVKLTINGKLIKSHIAPNTTLAEFIRNELKLTGTKLVCNQGECGSCTVLLDKKAIYSCHMLALDAADSEVITIEGLLNGNELHPIQKSFVDEDGLQCGFCTPGQIISAYAIIHENPKASDEDILIGMSGNLCRCGAYPKIINSVKSALRTKI